MFIKLDLRHQPFLNDIMHFLKKTSYLVVVKEKLMIIWLWLTFAKVVKMSIVTIDNSPPRYFTFTWTSRHWRSNWNSFWSSALMIASAKVVETSVVTPQRVHLRTARRLDHAIKCLLLSRAICFIKISVTWPSKFFLQSFLIKSTKNCNLSPC